MTSPSIFVRLSDCSKKELNHNTLAQLIFKDNWGVENCVVYIFYKEKIEEMQKHTERIKEELIDFMKQNLQMEEL